MLWYILMGSIALYYIWQRWQGSAWIDDIKSKCIFVTGCDSGFGRALAIRLDSMGCYTIAGCFTREGAAELDASTSDKLKTIQIDITNPESVAKAKEYVADNLPEGGLYALVNNAGVGGVGGPAEFLAPENYLNTFKVNVMGTAEVIRVFLPLLRQSRGRMVNMVSMAGRVAFPEMADYVASKFASEGLADTLRRELSAWGIRVIIISPGLFRTDIVNMEHHKKLKLKQWEALPEDVKNLYGETYLQQSIDYAESFLRKASTKLDLVVDAYIHALFALHPKTRYSVGKDAKFLCKLALLPSVAMDMFFSRIRHKYPQPKVLSS